MKKEFFGFYEPSQEEVDKSWKDGIFVFDANALLNLYRYSESTRKDFLLAITKLKDKLFMPYQVGLEYHSNRHLVIDSLNNSYHALLTSIRDIFEKNLSNLISQYSRHPSIQIEKLKKIHDDSLKKISTELERQKVNHPDFKDTDEILTKLTELYQNKVGDSFNKEMLKKIYQEGKERYEQQIPPGYKDLDTKRKRGDQHVYGDLIIWKEIIELTKKEKREIIFITDDRKEDWWTIENGKTIRPREELIKEFYDITGVRILIYNADNFLHYAKERKLVSMIKETSISEVKDVRKADEEYMTIADILRATTDNKIDVEHFLPASTKLPDYMRNIDRFNYSADHLFPINNSLTELYKSVKDYKSTLEHFYPPSSYFKDLYTQIKGNNGHYSKLFNSQHLEKNDSNVEGNEQNNRLNDGPPGNIEVPGQLDNEKEG